MKNLTPAITELIARSGIEPVNILEVQWADNGAFVKYAVKDIRDQGQPIDGTILDLSNLEAVVKLDLQGQSQAITVTLDDTDGSIKAIMDSIDIHGKAVRLMQWFENLPISESFKLYEGQISSPIIWNEGDRTVSFSVLTELANKQVGFSPEEADFPFLPDSLAGRPWPMAFGTVQNVPATRLQDIPATQTAQDLGVVDPSIAPRRRELSQLVTDLEDVKNANFFAAVVWFATELDTGATPEEIEFANQQGEAYLAQGNAAQAQQFGAGQELAQLAVTQKEQEAVNDGQLQLLDVSALPSESITIVVGGVELSGTLTGKTFKIDATVDPEFDGAFDEPFGFKYSAAGTTITLKTDTEIKYVANIVDSEIHNVQVFKQIENGQILITIPSDWYTVTKEVQGPYTFVLLSFPIPISTRDPSLKDDIFITQTSTVGPNTVDIMEYLITSYTDLTFDTTSFNHVKLKLENYPSHFAQLDRPNIFTMLEEMAFQCRCAIWVNAGVFRIKYLPESVDPDITITEANIDAGSLILSATETEELVTVLTATWVEDYAEEEPNKLTLRHRVKKYGTRERELNFYIYNLPDLVLKSATFWLIRLSNIWKIVSFNTYVDSLTIETFDTINLSFQNNLIANGDISGMVTDAVYDTGSHLLTLTCWVPVRFGEMEEYPFGWPSELLTDVRFPTKEDATEGWAGGDGPGSEVDGSFALSDANRATGSVSTVDNRGIGVNTDQGIQELYNDQRDFGQVQPTDLNDIRPIPSFTGIGFSTGVEPIFDYTYGDYTVDFQDTGEEFDETSVAFMAILESNISAAEGIIMGQGSAKLYSLVSKDGIVSLTPVLEANGQQAVKTIYNSVESEIQKLSGEVARTVQVKQIGNFFVIDVVPC